MSLIPFHCYRWSYWWITGHAGGLSRRHWLHSCGGAFFWVPSFTPSHKAIKVRRRLLASKASGDGVGQLHIYLHPHLWLCLHRAMLAHAVSGTGYIDVGNSAYSYSSSKKLWSTYHTPMLMSEVPGSSMFASAISAFLYHRLLHH